LLDKPHKPITPERDLKKFKDIFENKEPDKKSSRDNEKKENLHYQDFEADIFNKKQNTKLRKIYANRLFYLMVGWFSLQAIILICVGLGWMTFDPQIIKTLLITSAGKVVGLFLIVTRYLFNRKD